MTEAKDPTPGWYVVMREGEVVGCIFRGKAGWWKGVSRTGEWPYTDRTLGPKIDDLLRDAARYRLLFSAGREWREAAHALTAEYRREKPQTLPRNRAYTEAQLRLASLIDAEIVGDDG